MLRPTRLTSLVVLALFVAACDNPPLAVSPSPSEAAAAAVADSPTAAPSGSGGSGGSGVIEHATGPTDVLLRFDVGGGLVALALLATQAPIFTLYGDGTVIFRNPNLDPLPPIGSVAPLRSFRMTRLSEGQVQAVLADALGRGGLGAARSEYVDRQIMDLPSAVFTINADGIVKHVLINGLGIDIGYTPDAPALAAFAALAGRLGDFDEGGMLSANEYVPDRYRGSLLEGETPAPDVKAWPWTGISPAEFSSDSMDSQFPLRARVLSVLEVEALGISPYRGGFRGLTLAGPGDGKTYTFSLRPLLPDETK